MTASVTVINFDDDDLIGMNNKDAITFNAANLTTTTTTSSHVVRRNFPATFAIRNLFAENATKSTTTTTFNGMNNTLPYNNKNNNLSPSSLVYVAAAVTSNFATLSSSSSSALATSSAAHENMSFAYEEVEQDVINRSLLLTTVSATGTSSATTNNTVVTANNSITNNTITEEEWSHFYDLIFSWQGICLIAVFCTFIVITIIGNTLVIMAVITTRRLKTVTNCFVMSLAVADLLVGIFVMPPAVAVHLIGSWQLGWIVCDIWISLDVLLCTASILSLCAISVDRYLAVTRPLTYSRKRRSKRLALIMIFVVWVTALAITCPPILGWYEPGRRDLKECRYNQNEGYVIFSAMGSFFIPMAVMIYVYARISCVVASRHDNMTDISVHNKKFKRYTSADVENDIDHEFSEQDLSSGQKKQAAVRTFSNQTIAKELHEMLSDGELDGTGTGGGSHCHSLLTLSTTANAKNGCYELTRPASLKRTPTSSSTMTIMTSGCGAGGGGGGVGLGVGVSGSHSGVAATDLLWSQQQTQHTLHPLSRPHSIRHHYGGGGGGITTASTSPNMQDTAAAAVAGAAARQTTRVHHHHHPPKSLTNRITSLKKENKTTQTLSIVVGGFIACWLPFFVYYLITPFLHEHQVSTTLAKVLTWLGWFNSAINPFIYAFYSVDFRAAFWRLTCKRFFSGSMKPQFPTNTMSIRR